jgi:hypothetical protein
MREHDAFSPSRWQLVEDALIAVREAFADPVYVVLLEIVKLKHDTHAWVNSWPPPHPRPGIVSAAPVLIAPPAPALIASSRFCQRGQGLAVDFLTPFGGALLRLLIWAGFWLRYRSVVVAHDCLLLLEREPSTSPGVWVRYGIMRSFVG